MSLLNSERNLCLINIYIYPKKKKSTKQNISVCFFVFQICVSTPSVIFRDSQCRRTGPLLCHCGVPGHDP